jgi:hypothetical protein
VFCQVVNNSRQFLCMSFESRHLDGSYNPLVATLFPTCHRINILKVVFERLFSVVLFNFVLCYFI